MKYALLPSFRPEEAMKIGVLAAGAALALPIAAQAGRPAWKSYANAQYAYSICYPAAMKPQPEAPSGDGRIFTGTDGSELRVFGRFNAEEASLRALADAQATNLARGGKAAYRRQKDDWAVISGGNDDKIYYSKLFLRNGRVITFELTYPASASAKYTSIVDQLSRCFKPIKPASSVAVANPDISDKAFLRIQRIIKEHLLLTPKALECSFFMAREDSTERIVKVGVYEIHDKRCAGDPEVTHRLFDLEIDMKSGAAKWDMCGAEDMLPIPRAYPGYEVFRASCR